MMPLALLGRLLSAAIGVCFLGWCTMMGVAGTSPTTSPALERARMFSGKAVGIHVETTDVGGGYEKEESDSDLAWRRDARARESQVSSRPGRANGSTEPMVDLSQYNR